MNTQYRTLFTVAVSHAYHGGACPDLSFTVPGETAATLRRGRLLTRGGPGALRVLVQTNDDGTPLAPITGAELRFGLRLETPYFRHYTDFDVVTPLYANDGDALALDAPVSAHIVGGVARLSVAEEPRPVTLSLRGATGPALLTERARRVEDRDDLSFDLRPFPVGRYILETRSSAGTRTTPLIYDPELDAAGVFGVLALKLSSAVLADAPEFAISFAARAQPLRYFVVAQNMSLSDFNLLSVTDQGAAEDQRDPVIFERIASTDFAATDPSPTQLAGADGRVALFRSTTALPRSARGRRRIQLSRNGDVLVSNLPQPPTESDAADVIVRVSKP